MQTLLVEGALVLESAHVPPRHASILIEGDTVRALLAPGTPVSPDALRIDASDRLAIPGLVNAHTHSHLTFAKGVQDRWTLELHLNGGLWTNGERTAEQKRLAAMLGAAEMIRKGCTACYDLFMEIPVPSREGLLAVAQGYQDAGMRVLLAPMLADLTFWQAIPGLLDALPGDLRARAGALAATPYPSVLADFAATLRAWPHAADRAPLGLAPTIPLHCSDDYLRACARLARDQGLQLHMHLAESRVQAVSGLTRYGTSLTRHVDRMGLLGPHFTAAHAVWIDEEDMRLLAERGAKVAHNPGSNLRLGSGVARIRRMRELGIAIGIGTDASSCSDNLNMFEAARHAALLSHAMGPDTGAWLGARDVLQMATEGSAALLGLENRLGRIAPGCQADLVLLDLDHVNYLPLNDVPQQLVYVEDGTAVRRVMVGGRTIYEDGRFLAFDYARLRAEVEAAAEALREETGERRALAEALAPHVGAFCTCLAREPLPFDRYAARD